MRQKNIQTSIVMHGGNVKHACDKQQKYSKWTSYQTTKNSSSPITQIQVSQNDLSYPHLPRPKEQRKE